MNRIVASALVLLLGLAGGPAVAQGFSWYGKARTKAFIAYCKPALADERSTAYQNCNTVWNTFKEGYFAGLDTANKTCFIDHAQLEDLIAYVEAKGPDYVNGTGWIFTMREFIKVRLKQCEERRGREESR